MTDPPTAKLPCSFRTMNSEEVSLLEAGRTATESKYARLSGSRSLLLSVFISMMMNVFQADFRAVCG